MTTTSASQQQQKRPPVVTVMGHVDHGKSTLLDHIREANVVASEAGGITQHISAYEITHTRTDENTEEAITFLDTPGHAAFSNMRSRGAHVADVAILVVSAEDGVKDQTKEALEMIKEAGIPYVVAITKIDRPNADVTWTKNNLLENEIYIEGYGGDISCVPISAKTGEGVDELLDVVLLAAELEELTADPTQPAEGVVIESQVDPKKGTSATLIVTNGTLTQGECVRAEDAYAPVRMMENFRGERIERASFSQPIRITGFTKAPAVGSVFTTYKKKKDAEKDTAAYTETHESGAAADAPRADSDTSVTVPVILKADTNGTLEALETAVNQLEVPYANIQVIASGVGDIAESDAKMAAGTEYPLVIGFNVKEDKRASPILERSQAEVALFSVIYKATEWLEEQAGSRIPQEMKEEVHGTAEILRIFKAEKPKQVIGGKVQEGVIKNNASIKVYRRGNHIGTGTIIELQHLKDRVSEVEEGNEFGAMIESKLSIAKGDTIEAVTIPD